MQTQLDWRRIKRDLHRHQPHRSVRRTHDRVDSPTFLAFQQLVFERRADDAFEVVRSAARAAVFVCVDHANDSNTTLKLATQNYLEVMMHIRKWTGAVEASLQGCVCCFRRRKGPDGQWDADWRGQQTTIKGDLRSAMTHGCTRIRSLTLERESECEWPPMTLNPYTSDSLFVAYS